MTSLAPDRLQAGLDELAGGAPRTGRSVQGLSKFAATSQCGTSAAMFASQVNSDGLLRGTPHEVTPFQSRAAIARGTRVEQIARENDYEVTLGLAREHLGFTVDEVRTLNLRTGFPPNMAGMRDRSAATRDGLAQMLAGSSSAPNLIEAAVLRLPLHGRTWYLEADALGLRDVSLLHPLEVKSWAKIDEQFVDANRVGKAARQLGVYTYLAQQEVADLGGAPDATVATEGLLITPKNLSMTLTATRMDLRGPVRAADRLLAGLPDPATFVGQVAPDDGFGKVADKTAPPDARAAAAGDLLDLFGHHYTPDCQSSCGLWKLCRQRAYDAADPTVAGESVARAVGGVASLTRVLDLADGATPTTAEDTAAQRISAVGSLSTLAELSARGVA